MSLIVFLDAGPLGMVTNPRAGSDNEACARWLEALLTRRIHVVVPEIADYEVRRELMRARKSAGIKRLDDLKRVIAYQGLTTPIMLLAAQLWAEARQRGLPTADDRVLDADVILAAQARLAPIANEDDQVVVATTNVRHLERFVLAQLWKDVH
ncbi:MAG: nucleic acid-binding protein [Chloroflexi bacterium]|nr:nucleic acid-binding protein [Chloroflexota bacterium]